MLLLTAALTLIPTAPALAASLEEDWPEFQGPHRNGAVGPVGSDFAWGEDGPKIAWRKEIGSGYGGAAIADGEVFLLDRVAGERDLMRVFDLATGEELWSDGYDARGRLNFAGSRTVPSIQEGLVVTSGGFGHVAAFSRETKELDWLVSLEDEYGGVAPTFGWSAAPLVYDGLVIATALGEDVGLVAFELETGAEIWKTPGVGFSHSTPTLLEIQGKTRLVFLSTPERGRGDDKPLPTFINCFDPDSGELEWKREVEFSGLPIPTPIQIDADRLFMTGGYASGSMMLRVGESDGEIALEELFRTPRGAQIHRPLLHEDHLYVLANENQNYSARRQVEGGLMCLTLDGEELWRTKNDPYFGRGNAILAGDHLLIQDGFDGTLRVVEANPEAYTQVAEAKIFEIAERDGQLWAPMALAGNRLIMRSQEELVCVEL